MIPAYFIESRESERERERERERESYSRHAILLYKVLLTVSNDVNK